MSRSLLVVDQDERIGDLVGRVFANRCDVVAVQPCLALDWLDIHEGPDLVLLDLEIPDTRSWELLRVIADPEDGYLNTPVIGMSSASPWDDYVYARSIASDLRFLVKPFQLCELEQLVGNALNV